MGEGEVSLKSWPEHSSWSWCVMVGAGIPFSVIESMLLYFWFRCTVNRRGLREAFFQKLERHWGLVMEHVNR
jgi:hypothetical protein